MVLTYSMLSINIKQYEHNNAKLMILEKLNYKDKNQMQG